MTTSDTAPAGLPSLADLLARDPGAPARHLLALPVGVEPEDVWGAAVSRFGSAKWSPSGIEDEPGVRALRLSRLTVLAGPYAVDRGVAAALGLPAGTAVAYDVRGPQERGEPAEAGDDDLYGYTRAFATALPVRDEERVVRWLLAVARLHRGALRVGGTGTLLEPDPLSMLDRTLWSSVWLEPDAALAVARRVLRSARLDLDEIAWTGPKGDPIAAAGLTFERLDPEWRAELAAEVARADIEALSQEPALDGYGVVADLELDGTLSVEVGSQEVLPSILAGQDWAASGVVTYRVTWTPDDLDELALERPSLEHRVARGRVAPLMDRLVTAFHSTLGGVVVDDEGLVVPLR